MMQLSFKLAIKGGHLVTLWFGEYSCLGFGFSLYLWFCFCFCFGVQTPFDMVTATVRIKVSVGPF
jgi:hypothetical protein